MSLIKTRSHQLFPVLDASQVETARRFASGPARAFAPGEVVFDVGQRDVPMWLVLKGSLDVVRRDGLRHEAPIVTHNAGQFSGEISQLAGRETLAAACAGKKFFPLDKIWQRISCFGRRQSAHRLPLRSKRGPAKEHAPKIKDAAPRLGRTGCPQCLSAHLFQSFEKGDEIFDFSRRQDCEFAASFGLVIRRHDRIGEVSLWLNNNLS